MPALRRFGRPVRGRPRSRSGSAGDGERDQAGALRRLALGLGARHRRDVELALV